MAKLTRREFIETTALAGAIIGQPGTAGAAAGAALPVRDLGKTGAKVTLLAFGCGSRFLAYKDPADAERVLNEVIDGGIRYLDTAFGYGDGESETRVGRVMATRRKEVFLATKLFERSRKRDDILREFERSLKRLQTDRVDLLHIHSLKTAEDLAAIEAPDGALKVLYELRDQKVTRFIGMTSHTDGATMAQAIERHDLNCVQMAMNPSRALGFEELALPAANKKGLGVICMKVTAQEKLVGAGASQADMKSLLRYALSLPVSAAVIGMPSREHITENITLARAFAPMSPEEIDRVRDQVAPRRASVETFFIGHADA